MNVLVQVGDGKETVTSASEPLVSTPLKFNLEEYLYGALDRDHMCDKWMDLGRELGFKYTEVKNIGASNASHGPQVCLQALLDRWLNWAPPNHKFPVIEALITAVRKLGHEKLAWRLASDENLKHNCNLKSNSEHC